MKEEKCFEPNLNPVSQDESGVSVFLNGCKDDTGQKEDRDKKGSDISEQECPSDGEDGKV
jgi:hypothetical protein